MPEFFADRIGGAFDFVPLRGLRVQEVAAGGGLVFGMKVAEPAAQQSERSLIRDLIVKAPRGSVDRIGHLRGIA